MTLAPLRSALSDCAAQVDLDEPRVGGLRGVVQVRGGVLRYSPRLLPYLPRSCLALCGALSSVQCQLQGLQI